jgi:hypothetical protein
VVCFSTFHDILKNHFNLSFYAPKSDTWNRCDAFNIKIKKEKFSSTGIAQPKATAARKSKDEDTA